MPRPIDPRDGRAAPPSQAADLATFGASPAAFVGVAALAEDNSIASPPSTTTRLGPPAPRAEGDAPAIHETAPGGGGPAAPVALATPASTPAHGAPPATVNAAPPHAETAGIATFVPMPIPLAGGAAPPSPAHPGEAPAPAGSSVAATASVAPAASAPPAPSIDAVMTSMAALQDAVAALAGQLPANSGHIAVPVVGAVPVVAPADVPQGVADVLGTVSQATATVSPHIDATLDGAQRAVAAAAEDASHLAASLTSTVAAAAPAVDLTPVAVSLHTVVAAVHDIANITSSVTSPVTALAAPAIATVHAATEAFAGHDPAAGITTLVGMVSAADVFDLHDAGSAASDLLAPALGAIGAADLLADVAPADVLLGVHDHHDGGLGLDLDHGLLGHG